jgi:urease accessory protein
MEDCLMVVSRYLLPVAALVALSAPALAHTGVGPVNSFFSGLEHPVFGLDHLLAMVAVGLWAAVASPKLFWVAPLGFVAGMLGGGLLGMTGVAVPGIELMITGSVVLFGVLTFFKLQTAAIISFLAAAIFGAAHGFAHGAEMPDGGVAIQYAAGFLIATAALHAIGALAGFSARYFNAVRAGQAAGGAVALAGIALMVA